MHRSMLFAATITATAILAAGVTGVAGAAKMYTILGANLAGMGDHGVVNLHHDAKTGKLCWTFSVATHGITGASIRDNAGMLVTSLGSGYQAKSCATVTMKALDLIETKPGSYTVWLDTKGHMGGLRGKLFAGMAHMTHM